MTVTDAEDGYGDSQNPEGDYGDSQQPGTLYADSSTAKPTPPPGTKGSASGSSPQTSTATSVIQVSVNPGSKIKLAAFVDLINKTPGIAPEFKGKIKLDRKSNAIEVPDFSGQKVVPGKEWLFDLGKAGSDWEITTATLWLSLTSASFKFKEDLANGEERGFATSKDPDDSLLSPSHDLLVSSGLILGLTIPNQVFLDKHPPPPDRLPPPQIARLKSGKGLILIAREIVVEKGGKFTKSSVAIPKGMMAMTFFHELSAHASFFQLGQDAAHSEPLDPANNAVDRNAAQAESSYRPLIAKEQTALEKKLQSLIDAMKKAVP
jgi:hypothetical protein